MSKLIPDSYSTQRIVPEKCNCFKSTISKIAVILSQSFPKSDQFCCSMQTGRCLPYEATVLSSTPGLVQSAAPRVFGRGSGLRCGFGFAFGKSFGVPSIYSRGNRLRTLGTSRGNSFTTLHPRLFNRLSF